MELIQTHFHFEHPYIMASLSLCLFNTNPAHVLHELWAVNSMRKEQGHWGENSSINTDTSPLLYNISKHLTGGKMKFKIQSLHMWRGRPALRSSSVAPGVGQGGYLHLYFADAGEHHVKRL